MVALVVATELAHPGDTILFDNQSVVKVNLQACTRPCPDQDFWDIAYNNIFKRTGDRPWLVHAAATSVRREAAEWTARAQEEVRPHIQYPPAEIQLLRTVTQRCSGWRGAIMYAWQALRNNQRAVVCTSAYLVGRYLALLWTWIGHF